MAVDCGFDYSCSVQPEIDATLAEAFASAGLSRCALAMDTSGATYGSALALAGAGIALDGYRELPLAAGAEACASACLDALAAFPALSMSGVTVRRLWLTAEDDSAGQPGQPLIDALAAAVETCSGYDVGIYTGAWFWPDYMLDTQQFAGLPLWDADYNGVAGLSVVTYGGWTVANARQYNSPVTVAGIGLDLDVFGV